LHFPWSPENQASGYKPLDNDAGFLLDIGGRKIVALKLSGNVARKVAWQTPGISNVLARFAKVRRPAEPGRWLIVADLLNGSPNEHDNFPSLVARRLTDATGVTVEVSNLVMARKARAGEKTQASPLAVS
jgi:hypothetical protein